MMNCNLIVSEPAPHGCGAIRRTAYLILLIWCGTLMCDTTAFAQTSNGPASSAPPTEILVTQIVGFAGTSSNAKGRLSFHDNSLQFKKEKTASVQIELASIQNAVLGEESKQVGGLPMTLGKVAAPYGGGRVVSLFSHKKFDTLTLEYLDPNGAFHGAIFQLEKGQGQAFRDELVARGAHVTQSTSQVQNESK